jgi:2-polyprenyl-3-methyl-5-hydroxy-6-metoxy-1,4-benzoquinol methylase
MSQTVAQAHAAEVNAGERFEFGANWALFLKQMNDERLAEAKASLASMLEVSDLKGKTFIDIGSGSGLFSLAARSLGANVFSFDYDTNSVNCTQELRRRYFANDENWHVEQGSVLDAAYLAKLGQYDVVYSWGVLHHTGQMWNAIDNASKLVKPGGLFFIAIYNDQGGNSKLWKIIKRWYCKSPGLLKPVVLAGACVYLYTGPFLLGLVRGKPFRFLEGYHYRGMSFWRDVVDWVGGYPFEVAGTGPIFDFMKKRGFSLRLLQSTHSVGCNEFVFNKDGGPRPIA